MIQDSEPIKNEVRATPPSDSIDESIEQLSQNFESAYVFFEDRIFQSSIHSGTLFSSQPTSYIEKTIIRQPTAGKSPYLISAVIYDIANPILLFRDQIDLLCRCNSSTSKKYPTCDFYNIILVSNAEQSAIRCYPELLLYFANHDAKWQTLSPIHKELSQLLKDEQILDLDISPDSYLSTQITSLVQLIQDPNIIPFIKEYWIDINAIPIPIILDEEAAAFFLSKYPICPRIWTGEQEKSIPSQMNSDDELDQFIENAQIKYALDFPTRPNQMVMTALLTGLKNDVNTITPNPFIRALSPAMEDKYVKYMKIQFEIAKSNQISVISLNSYTVNSLLEEKRIYLVNLHSLKNWKNLEYNMDSLSNPQIYCVPALLLPNQKPMSLTTEEESLSPFLIHIQNILKSISDENFQIIDHPISSKFYLYRNFGDLTGKKEKIILVISDIGEDIIGENFLPTIHQFGLSKIIYIFEKLFLEEEVQEFGYQLKDWLAEYYSPLLLLSKIAIELKKTYPFHFIFHGLYANLFDKADYALRFQPNSIRLFKLPLSLAKAFEITDSKKIAAFIGSITGKPISESSKDNTNSQDLIDFFDTVQEPEESFEDIEENTQDKDRDLDQQNPLDDSDQREDKLDNKEEDNSDISSEKEIPENNIPKSK